MTAEGEENKKKRRKKRENPSYMRLSLCYYYTITLYVRSRRATKFLYLDVLWAKKSRELSMQSTWDFHGPVPPKTERQTTSRTYIVSRKDR